MVTVDSNPAGRAQRTNVSEHVWLRLESAPKRPFRKKVWYSPSQKGRTLINRRDDIP